VNGHSSRRVTLKKKWNTGSFAMIVYDVDDKLETGRRLSYILVVCVVAV